MVPRTECHRDSLNMCMWWLNVTLWDYNLRQNSQGCCNIGYPSDAHHILKSRKISFVQIFHFGSQNILQIFTKHVRYTAVPYAKFQHQKFENLAKGFGKISCHEMWVSDTFRMTSLYCYILFWSIYFKISPLWSPQATLKMGKYHIAKEKLII